MSLPNQPISIEESSVETVAVVVAVTGDTMTLAATRKSACDSCAAAKGCGVSALSGLFGNKQLQFTTKKVRDAKVGEAFVVGISQKALLKIAATAYLLPLLGVLGGAIGAAGVGASDLGAAVGAVLGLAAGLSLARKLSQGPRLLAGANPTILRRHQIIGTGNCHE